MKFLRPIIYIFFILAALELTLNILDIPKDYKPHTTPDQFWKALDSDFPYVNSKSTSIDFVYDRNPRGYFHYDNTVQHVTNSAGYRGPEILLHKPDGNYRIFFLGDSYTFGEGVYFEDTFPEQFKKLAGDKNLFGGKKIEAINMGVGGYNTSQEYTTLAVAAKDGLDPDRVVVQYAMNDAEGELLKFNPDGSYTRNQSEVELYTKSKQNVPPIFKASRILRVIRDWYLGRIITDKTVSYYHGLYQDSNPNWAATKQAIADFAAFQKKTGKPVTFVIYPLLFDLKKYPFVTEELKVEEELKKNGIEYINLRDNLSNYSGPELWVHPTDQHPNEIMHRIAAQALADHFAQSQIK